MRSWTLDEVIKATGGQVLQSGTSNFTGVGTDTRKDLSGQLFIALKGESFDGHGFLPAAIQQKAAGLLVHEASRVPAGVPSSVTVILVQDSLRALQAMGLFHRRRSKARVLALTGSNGKTTTKEFAAAVLSPFREVHYSRGSFNNHWGVPFTLLDLEDHHDVAVVEMGMNHAGEITELVHMADPDVVLCTMVGRAHIEHFGTVDGIAKAKEEIYLAARPRADRIYNLDNPHTRLMYNRSASLFPKTQIWTFSSVEASADVHLRLVSVGLKELILEGEILGEEGRVRVPVFGTQNLTNLMAAAALGLSAGLEPGDVWKGLENCRTSWGRNQFVQLKSGAEMIFDGYNANPDSMKALLENLLRVETKGRKIGVFGQMLELGEASADFHREVARVAAHAGFAELYFIGPDHQAFATGLKEAGFSGRAHLAEDFVESLGADLARKLQPGDLIAIKGSRGMKLERFVYPCEPLDFGGK